MYVIDRKYNPKVAWRTIASAVRQTVRATADTPAEYRIRVKAVDQNEVIPDDIDIGYYFTDYIGTPYSVKTHGTEIEIVSPSILTVINGYLYNWWAAIGDTNGDGISETSITSDDNWVIPRYTLYTAGGDFSILTTYLGGSSVAGGKMKETGIVYWISPNTGATNEVGFNGRGAGQRTNVGYLYTKQYLTMWQNVAQDATNAVIATLNAYDGTIYPGTATGWDALEKFKGCSIRLVRTSTTLTHGQTGTYVGNDGKIYRTICIGTQEWLADNLCETKYRDGTTIPFQGVNPGYYTDAEWNALTTGARSTYLEDPNTYGFTLIPEVDAVYTTLDLSDDFMTGACPTSGHCGIVHKSAYKGYSLYLPADMFRHLHPIAFQNNNKYTMAILWNNDPNPMRYTFTSTDNPTITNYQGTQADGHILSDDYGEKPKCRLFQVDPSDPNGLIERTEKPYYKFVAGLLDEITFGILPEVTDWIIEISR